MDAYIFGLLIITTCIGISYYKGYINKMIKWFNVRRQKVKLILSLIDKIQKEISVANKSTSVFTINDTDASASIIYQRLGQQYVMLVPYNRKYAIAMSQFKVELVRDNNSTLDITQQPGIPYLVNAKDLGGHTIRMSNQETGKSYEYSQNIIPMYGEEIIDFE